MAENPKKLPVALIIGASRGIGRQVAIDLAKNGYFVVVSAKTTSDASLIPPTSFPPDPNSSHSTINTVAREITSSSSSSSPLHPTGYCIAIPCDVRFPDQITSLIDDTVSRLGSLDVLIYNSGAIWWSPVSTTPLSRFKLMQQINPEGLYAAIQACLPHWERQSWKARIIVVSPPIYSRFFRGKTAYAMGKVGMSVLTKGLAMDWKREDKYKGMAITSLWPAVSIESAATQRAVATDQDVRRDLRKPSVFSDAVLGMLRSEVAEVNGLLDLDEDFLRRKHGWGDREMERYSVVPGSRPRRIMPLVFPTLEVEEQDDEGRRVDSVRQREVFQRQGSKL